MVAIWNAFKTKYSSETAWRLSFLVPAAIVFCVAIGQVFLADDCPKGNYKELEAHGAMARKSSAVSFKKVRCFRLFFHSFSWLAVAEDEQRGGYVQRCVCARGKAHSVF